MPGRPLPAAAAVDRRPDWQQANPAWIRHALALSQKLTGGGWYVLDAARSIRVRPRCFLVRGRRLVAFRQGPRVIVGPESCPHLGAPLCEGRVRHGRLVCPWHGLELGPEGHGGWKPLPTHDDGILLWVQIADDDALTDAPFLAARPARPIEAVLRIEAACEPRDIIANRLDPWHGAHYHPHSFATLRVIDQKADAITVRVAFRVLGPLVVEVDASFHCPDPRTIVMTIVRGEGEGSLVETHATPITPGRTAVIETTLATSERAAFGLARRLAPAIRPVLRWASRRLWVEDAAYAERLHTLRISSSPSAAPPSAQQRTR